jgi:hypothetical protein
VRAARPLSKIEETDLLTTPAEAAGTGPGVWVVLAEAVLVGLVTLLKELLAVIDVVVEIEVAVETGLTTDN